MAAAISRRDAMKYAAVAAGATTTPGYRWAWQTKAWSGGKLHPAAPLYQMEVVTASDPGALIDGISVDVDQVFGADFGQWDLPR